MTDAALMHVVAAWRRADPDLGRVSRIMRQTFDQLYDGQHTGRFRWDQLYKTDRIGVRVTSEQNHHDGTGGEWAVARSPALYAARCSSCPMRSAWSAS